MCCQKFPSLTIRRAWCRYLTLMILAIGFTIALGFIASVVLTFVCMIIGLAISLKLKYAPDEYFGTSWEIDEPAPDVERASDLAVTLIDTDPSSPKKTIAHEAPKKRPRLYYLDNLKIVLTVVVIFHHSICTFSGAGVIFMIGHYRNSLSNFLGPAILILNQSYFMCLFFFISGYFTPTSCDRKGVREFLTDKYKRLGIPFTAYIFLLGPLCNGAVSVFTGSNFSYRPDPGPLWFVGWLCIFNTMYATLERKSYSNVVMTRPSLWKLMGIGIGAGVFQGLIFPLGQFITMPITFGSLPFDILAFTGGVLAKRNDWLADPLTGTEVLAGRIGTVLFAGFLFAFFGMYYFNDSSPNFGGGFSDLECSADGVVAKQAPPPLMSMVKILVPLALLAGVSCMMVMFAALEIFRQHFNFRNVLTDFMSQASYTVYIIHFWVLTLMTEICIQVLNTQDGVNIRFEGGKQASSSCVGGDSRLWIAFVCTSLATQAVSWPLGWALRRLPGLRRIL
jgi:fucose 4-O-acetylase-like acetyltransferase